MNIPKVLEFIDQAVYSKTDKHLTKLQRTILEGTLKEQTYSDIGETNGFSEGHVKDVGYELLQLLSDIFETDINKRNFKSFLEKKLISILLVIITVVMVIYILMFMAIALHLHPQKNQKHQNIKKLNIK
jgi:ascorbate-specific PTS system EIIC-type component UlaA